MMHPKLVPCVLGFLLTGMSPMAAGATAAPASSSDDRAAELNIMDFGAAADGRQLDTKAIQAAIDACSRSGGGRLVFPVGKYLTGTIYIKKGVEIHLKKDAVILGSTNIKDYANDTGGIRYSTSWMDRCLIYARDADNIAITGDGTLDGQGARENFPTGKVGFDRPMLLRLYKCSNVVLRDFTMRNPASWGSAIIACDNIDVRNLTIRNLANWNGDGLNFDSCRNVTVDRCDIIASDDCICLQASEEDRACENIKITNCRLSSKWAAIRIGLLTRSDIRNVEMRDCHFYDVYDCGFKLQMGEGAVMENMRFENITMEYVTRPIFITLNSHRYTRELIDVPLPPPGTLRNISFVNIKAKAGYAATKAATSVPTDQSRRGEDARKRESYVAIIGVPEKKIENLEFINVAITFPGGGTAAMAQRRDVPELSDFKPEHFEFKGDLPAYGFYIRHAKGITLHDVKLGYEAEEKRPAIVCDDVETFHTTRLQARSAAGVAPVVKY